MGRRTTRRTIQFEDGGVTVVKQTVIVTRGDSVEKRRVWGQRRRQRLRRRKKPQREEGKLKQRGRKTLNSAYSTSGGRLEDGHVR